MNQIRRHVTYANVMSSLAVFMVLGGATAVAATKIGANEIKANSIKTGKIVKEAVTAGKIKKNAVTEAKIAAGAVTNAKIVDNAVTTSKIADNAVTTAKIADDAVTGAKVNEGSLGTVPSANVANSLVGVTPLKLVKTTSSASGATSDEAAAAATAVTLYEDSQFRIYGKCFIDNTAPAELEAKTYIETKQNGAIFDSDAGELSGEPPNGYLDTGTAETLRDMIEEGTEINKANIQYEGDTEFGATAADGYTIQGFTKVAVKFGTPPGGNGPYGPGNVCLFVTSVES